MTLETTMQLSTATANQRAKGYFPELLGLRFTEIGRERIVCEMPVRTALLAPNGFLHAAAVIGIADTACGFGSIASLPDGAENFATLELKSNFFGTARDGSLRAVALLMHGGRSTQVWDADVTHVESDRRIAAFRCTQLILYPRADAT